MRIFIPPVLLCLALASFGDDKPFPPEARCFLDAATKLMGDETECDRDLGSSLARQVVRARLEPLLIAMKDKNPEVRDRSRNVLLAMIPAAEPTRAPAVSSEESKLVARALRCIELALKQEKRPDHRKRLEFDHAVWSGKLAVLQARASTQAKLWKQVGLNRTPINNLLIKHLRAMTDGILKSVSDGIVVQRVAQNSVASRLGLLSGDIILSVEGRPVRSIEDLLNNSGLKKASRIEVLRWGGRMVLPRR